MKFQDLGDFRKDVRRLRKKFKSVDEDLAVIKKVLTVMPEERPPLSHKITHPRSDVDIINITVTSKSLKGMGVSSGLRLVYALFRQDERIVMLGMFHRDDRPSPEIRILTRKF